MSDIERLKAQRLAAIKATEGGAPERTGNPFFGVGPITDGAADEVDSRLLKFEFEHWLEENYRKRDDRGRDLGPFTAAEVGRSMHRGYPADKFLLDMMREIHRYFAFPKENRMAIGLGGGHSGFTVCVQHLITTRDSSQHVFVDTLRPESEGAKASGFFRQSWGTQIIEMMRHARDGDEGRIHFAEKEGVVPPAETLADMGVKLVIGVGHETTGASTYATADVQRLLAWIDMNPTEHHAVLDATSMLGAMPWGETLVHEVTQRCCLFMPFQKAIGGVAGYYVASFTPAALDLIERNQQQPSWAIPRQFKLATPVDPKKPLTGERSVNIGPIYDPAQDKMLGGVINTFSTLAFAETTFGLLRTEKRVGSVADLNARSSKNRDEVNRWVAANPLFELGVRDPDYRGAAVTLLKVRDPDITDPAIHTRIVAYSKAILSYTGVTHPNGSYEPGLDVARYINAFPGTPGDYRAWIGGIRPVSDVTALLENLQYAWQRAKAVVLEEELAALGETFPAADAAAVNRRMDDPERAYKVLICDRVGLKFDADGLPDHSEVKAHVEASGGVFHETARADENELEKGKIHFFYIPDISSEDEIMAAAGDGQYDAVIAAATFLPKAAVFKLGGVRIGAGTGNMGSASWGGGDGRGGWAPLMNTPSFNSRATAQMTMKALLKVLPDLPVEELHAATAAGDFDTGRDLRKVPTEKLEGKTIAVFGYGNIGREVAKLAAAFGMNVRVFARANHRPWIESEGFTFAATREEAAEGADVLSLHTGLGALDPQTGQFANAGFLGESVFAAVNHGAVLLNYDRGEGVDVDALDRALASGRIRHAAVDADLFTDPQTGAVSGPMAPYLPLSEKYPGRLALLPHAAADTEHHSRVEGAKQAVDQILDLIRFHRVVNLKGELPDGYTDGGAQAVAGVGAASAGDITSLAADRTSLDEARRTAENLAAVWGALASATDAERQAMLTDRYGGALLKAYNTHKSLMHEFGIEGPFRD
ncbi:NAD(P)-dependent oxidoreductase [Salinisphaera sp. LB1]|uniref:NAD(P)-dependent oxidoreductase n=1 Tax=Salinisphaera sp. LB1 TaxID=2183911 RepID=UPI000D707244|nr:NAD(P)-dependent oxidoreductase [Salinisphaera sp. LB1]AWN16461.1 D-3-phosphoglycerate dehydrogenase [Salinisphaera sp. LB1]